MTATEKVYELLPIDNWEGWTSEYDYLRGLFAYEFGGRREDIAAYIKLRAKAERMALSAGWEGDLHTVFVSALPPGNGSSDCPVMIAWKQSNNGTTFVYSPWPLPWLEKARD